MENESETYGYVNRGAKYGGPCPVKKLATNTFVSLTPSHRQFQSKGKFTKDNTLGEQKVNEENEVGDREESEAGQQKEMENEVGDREESEAGQQKEMENEVGDREESEAGQQKEMGIGDELKEKFISLLLHDERVQSIIVSIVNKSKSSCTNVNTEEGITGTYIRRTYDLKGVSLSCPDCPLKHTYTSGAGFVKHRKIKHGGVIVLPKENEVGDREESEAGQQKEMFQGSKKKKRPQNANDNEGEGEGEKIVKLLTDRRKLIAIGNIMQLRPFKVHGNYILKNIHTHHMDTYLKKTLLYSGQEDLLNDIFVT